MKRHLLSVSLATALAAVVVGAAAAASGGSTASILIRHQVRGCHSWSLNGGPFQASQSLSLRNGAALTITNNDVMPHKLVLLSGPAVSIKNLQTPFRMGIHGTFGAGMMAHMGA